MNLLVGRLLMCMLLLIVRSSCEVIENSKVMMCNDRERQALLDFKQGLVGDFEKDLSSWGGKDCCRWKGIGCDNQTGHVIKLVFQPQPAAQLTTSEIRPSLLQLHYLSHLHLSFDAYGSIPEFIGLLTNLTYLNLSRCELSGAIPPNLGNLTSLRSLDLSVNSITVDNFEWLSRLTSLRLVRMPDLNLSGAVDWFQSIKNLPSLYLLDLSGSQLPQPNNLFPRRSYVNASNSLEVLDLSSNPFMITSSSRLFPSWLCNISRNLVDLRLSDNELQGPVPDSLGDIMPSLAHLHLSQNRLQGVIPKSLGNLCSLQTLDMSSNMNLSEQLPLLLQNLSAGCTKDSLEILSLSSNNLTGSLLGITRFSSLRELHLQNNHLEGSFPEKFGQLLSKLVVLNLQRNWLTGPLPESIGQLSSLKVLDVSSNSLNGVITETHLSNHSELQLLGLASNRFTLNFSSSWLPGFQLHTINLRSCKLGPRFPRWLRIQNSFSYLDISESEISDTIPDAFWNISSELRYLNLSSNHINGTMPNLSLKFGDFTLVDLSSNLFYGPVPPFLSQSMLLNLSKNKFSGSISNFLCTKMDRTMLTLLDLSDNVLSGGLPNCWMELNSLRILNLGNNNFSGEIPSSMGSLGYEIIYLRLRNNSFSGELPLSLKECTTLEVLDVGENNLSGEIPTWIGESLKGLTVLRLRSNNFSGDIPSNICQLEFLQALDLSLNSISGSIPTCVDNLTAMSRNITSKISLSYSFSGPDTSYGYQDRTVIVWKGNEQEFGENLELLTLIDLSSNKLSGEIPEQVTRLFGLITLNLSRNSLAGIIPKKIGQLKALQSLDLSQNRISGEIPPSLADISYLGVLDLSNNDLSGKIPSGTQLQTFDASKYMGNPQLCGLPLLIRCPGDETLMQDHPPNTGTGGGGENKIQEGGDQWYSWSFVSMGLGFTLGFCGVCGNLLLSSTWRNAYFQFLEDVWDWLYVAIVVNIAKLQRRLQG